MDKHSRAQRIADEIMSSERYAKSRVFEDRIYRDEPIIRTGSQVLTSWNSKKRLPAEERKRTASGSVSTHATQQPTLWPLHADNRATIQTHTSELHNERARASANDGVLSRFTKMRRLAKKRVPNGYAYASGARLFYEQGKYMEDFEDDFDGACEFDQYYPTYDVMGDYQLRCYFSWRTRYRSGRSEKAPLSFLFMHAYELLCGIGVTPGMEGLEALKRLANEYKGASSSFDSHLERWIHDYVVYYALDKALVPASRGSFSVASVVTLHAAQEALLRSGSVTWPKSPVDSMPSPDELLDALCKLSRYRAEKSRFVRGHREDVAQVAASVFARMVAHCHKRRKTDYVQGLFGVPTRVQYAMFPSAIYWSPTSHEDAEYVLSEAEKYQCERGFWWRVLPCRRLDTNRELGALMHAIDARMRIAVGDAHPLKERKLPKYQAKFVDDAISAYLARKEAEEAARIRIDRSSLSSIRSASERTREALLTDDERDIEPVPRLTNPSLQVESKVEVEPQAQDEGSKNGNAHSVEGLSDRQVQLLEALLNEESIDGLDPMFVSLAVDAINEVFLDIVGDVVVEFEGTLPMLVEDYVEDVRETLG